MASGPELVSLRSGRGSAVLLAAALLLPSVAGGQEQLQILPALSSAGGVTSAGAFQIISATGQPSAVGLYDHGALMHNTGWVRWTPSVWEPDPLRIIEVHVVAVTPDTAILSFSTSHASLGTVTFGPDEAYGSVAQSAGSNLVRLTGLDAGDVVHYRLTVTDDQGRERSTRDLRLCTPTVDELALGRLEASYYSGTAFDEFVLSRPEATIDQPLRSDNDRFGDFGTGAGPENFSVRWTGMVNIDEAADYTWEGTTDDGMRLYVDEAPILDYWLVGQRASARRANQALDAAWHPLRFEFFTTEGAATARLRISGGNIPLRVLPPERVAYLTEAFFEPNFVPRDEPVSFECLEIRSSGRKTLLSPEVFDCHDPAVQVSSNAPPSFDFGETQVVWTATNNLGYEARYSEFVTVVDTRPPVIEPIQDMGVEATSPLGTPVQNLSAVTATDDCSDAVTTRYSVCKDVEGGDCQACWTAADAAADPARVAGARNAACACVDPPARYPYGETTLTGMAFDAAGNCASAAFVLEITDTTPPTISVEGDVVVQCSEFQIPRVTALDNVSAAEDIEVTCLSPQDQVPGSCDRRLDLGYGDHLILVTATDGQDQRSETELLIVQSRQQVDTRAPDVALVSAPQGFVNAPASVAVSVLDACDPEPALELAPAPDVLSSEEGVHTGGYAGEGLYEVVATATDHADNLSTLDVPPFGIDLTPPEATFRGVTAAPDPDDPLTWPVYFAGDSIAFTAGGSDTAGAAPSGIATVSVTLTRLDAAETRPLLVAELALDDSVPPRGPARAKNLTCDEVVPEGGRPWCNDAGEIDASALPAGDYLLAVRVTDVAGNFHDIELPFSRITWHVAMERANDRAQSLLAGDPPALVALYLEQIPREIEAALNAVDTPELVGNALLYTYTFTAALGEAAAAGLDVGNTAYLLDRGAYGAIDAHHRYVSDEVGDDDPDVEQASEYMQDALDYMEGDPPSPLASLLALMNAYFYLEHALQPFLVQDFEDAASAGQAIRGKLRDYLALEVANGKDLVQEIGDHAEAIHEGTLFGLALEQSEGGHTAYLELLRRLNTMSDLMADAQDNWVWVRNWQWPVSLQVRVLAGIGIALVAETLHDDPVEPANPLLAYARGQYDLGVGFMDDRLVDDALDVYVDNRCLIYEVYNLGNYRPVGIPPAEWGCPDCTLSADCPHP